MRFLFQFANCRRCRFKTQVSTTSGQVDREASVSTGRNGYRYYRARSNGPSMVAQPETATWGPWRATGCNGQATQSRSLGDHQ